MYLPHRPLLFVAAATLLVGCGLAGDPSSTDDPEGGSGGASNNGGAGENLCAPVAEVACGNSIAADTADLNDGTTTVIDGYATGVGNYSGPEIAYTFVAPSSREVTFGFVDPKPTEIDQDLFILDGSIGCTGEAAIERGFNSITFDAIAGSTYYLVVDGFAGAAGPFEATLECGTPVGTPDQGTYGTCAFGWTTNDLRNADHLRVDLDGQYESAESVPTQLGEQMLEGLKADPWAEVETVADIFEYIDEGGVYEHNVRLLTNGRRYTWVQWYSGDTEVGYLFDEGTVNLVAYVGDGDINDCMVSP